MSAPRAKRPFTGAASDPAQRQITAFFHAATANTTGAGPESITSSRPVLPADTQSNLLNVGMRVRKSVPEGYKTGAHNAFSLFSEIENKQSTITAVAAPSPVTRTPSSSSSSSSSYAFAPGPRELLPFCGINKIGGLSSQPQPSFSFTSDATPLTTHALPRDSLPDIDDVPSLSSSQDSVASTASALCINTNLTRSTNRKRVYDEGEESDTPSVSDCLQVPSGDWMDGQVSPRSLVPAGWENTRVMAVPKKIRRTLRGSAITGLDNKALDQLGQENMVLDDDFPEADFLDYRVLGGDPMEI